MMAPFSQPWVANDTPRRYEWKGVAFWPLSLSQLPRLTDEMSKSAVVPPVREHILGVIGKNVWMETRSSRVIMR